MLERLSKGGVDQTGPAQYAGSIGLDGTTGGRFAPQPKNLLTNIAHASLSAVKWLISSRL